jgi:hypothetical protein
MGGFYLRGPTHSIVNTCPNRCRCRGYHGVIDQTIQDFLIRKVDRILNLEDLPPNMRDEMVQSHLPDDMHYKVIPNSNPNVW